MSRFFVVTEQASTGDNVFLYDGDSSGLSLVASGRIAPDGTALDDSDTGGDVSADGKYAAVAHSELDPGNFTATIFNIEDGSISVAAHALGVDTAQRGWDIQFNSDASRYWHAHWQRWMRAGSFDGSSATTLGSYRTAGDSFGRYALAAFKNGTRAIFVVDSKIHFLEESGGTVSELSSIVPKNPPMQGGVRLSPDESHLAVHTGPSSSAGGTDGQLTVYSVGASSLTEVANITGIARRRNVVWSADGSRIYLGAAVYAFDGSALTESAAYTGTRHVAVDANETFILTSSDAASASINLIDGSSKSVIETLVLPGSPNYIQAVPALGPTTNEELFQASYADASAADPKVTALIRPADVQRSIDSDVSNLKDGPDFYTVEAIFDLGELSNLNPYNATTEKPRVFYVKDDQPGLRDGKNLLLKGYQIRSADPSVPVTCTFWGY